MLISPANKADAKDLAYLINQAGEGIPEYLWSSTCEDGEQPLDVGVRRASREDGGFSYKNARVIHQENQVAGMIISYPLDDPYVVGDLDEYPKVVRPLIELEMLAPGSWYINALATYDRFRRQGIAKELMVEAEWLAQRQKVQTMSVIVASENPVAKRLYLSLGYTIEASRPVQNYPTAMHGGDWELLIKPLVV